MFVLFICLISFRQGKSRIYNPQSHSINQLVKQIQYLSHTLRKQMRRQPQYQVDHYPLPSQSFSIENSSHNDALYFETPTTSPPYQSRKFGFSARIFPLLGSVIATVSILWTYLVAVSKNPPDVKPFPYTDITHTAIHFPEYIIFRIGMMCAPVFFAITLQILKNYLNSQSFQIFGHEQARLNSFGHLSVACCLLLCLSTSTISDGQDIGWTLHSIGATGFFILSIYMCRVAAKIYMKIYVQKQFCASWSYNIKKYIDFFLIGLLVLQLIDSLKLADIGSLLEWVATFYLIVYFFSLYYDFEGMTINLHRKN